MAPTFDVVPVLEHDEWVVRDSTAVLAECIRAGSGLGWVAPPPAAQVDAIVRRCVQARAGGDGSMVAAYVDSAQVGVGWWLRYERETQRRNGDLDKLAVMPGFQRRGIGRAMLSVLVEDARRAGVELLTLDVRGDTAHARRLYAAQGFEVYGVLPDSVVFPYGRFDKVMMVKDLRTPQVTPPDRPPAP